jgi:hypothetical protein
VRNVVTDESLREELATEQRRANLRRDGIASAEAVGRRRHQIAAVGLIVAVGMLLAVLFAANVIQLGSGSQWIDSDVARFATIAFGIVMVMYAFDQERHLRRVERGRAQLVALESDIASNLLAAGFVLDAACAVHSSVELDTVVASIVEQGRGLVGGEHGVLFVIDEHGGLEPAYDPEGVAPVGAPIAEIVAGRRKVMAITETGGTDIGVPLLHGADLLAVLVLPEVLAARLTPDLEAVLGRFGTEAAAALANARRYEAAMFLLDVAS